MSPISWRGRWLAAGAIAAVGVGFYLQHTGRLGSSASRKMSPLLRGYREPGTYVVELLPGIRQEALGEAVQQSGMLLRAHPSLMSKHLLVTGTQAQLRELADRKEIAYVFPASLELMAGEELEACPGPLIMEEGTIGQYVKVGNGWLSRTGNEVVIQVVFGSLAPRVAPNIVEAEIMRAFEEWARYAPVRFAQGSAAEGAQTISIRFAGGTHGDGYAFDGRGHVLAHTFFPAPPNAEPAAGDMHFDADEDWGGRTDLYTVALHEAGHALGLAHSDRPGAVMYPYYRTGLMLSDDDIAGVRALYGSRELPVTPVAPAPAPRPAAPPVTPPSAPPVIPPAAPTPAPTPPQSGDTTPPVLRITSPASTIVSTPAASITLRGIASDAGGVAEISWVNAAGGAGSATGTRTWSAVVPLAVGTNSVTVRARDQAGNTSWRTVTVVRK